MRAVGISEMDDLKIAEKTLKSQNANFVLVKDSKPIIITDSPGLEGPISAASSHPQEAVGSAVADRIVGKAAALLYAYMRIDSAFALTISREGQKVLEEYGIKNKSEKVIPHIIGRDGKNICIFEKAVDGIDNLEKAYQTLKKMKTHHPNPSVHDHIKS